MKICCGRIAGITMLALMLAVSASAANIRVCPDGCEYSSIQKAINASSNGDTILVQSGTYFENVKVNKKLTLRGIGNPVVDTGGSGSAITLSANGITLEGFTATGGYGNFYPYFPEAGIKITSSNNTLIGNNASSNLYGIWLYSSSNNMIIGNNVSDNVENYYGIGAGIFLDSSSNNTLIGNNASNNLIGIHLGSSSNNTLTGNNASNNEIYSRIGKKTGSGISLDYSGNNTLIGNNASNNGYTGIDLSYSGKNTMSGNMMTGNQENFDMDGESDSDFENHIDTGNLVDGRLIYLIIKASDTTYDSSSNAGTLYCISCVNVTIKNLNLNKNGKGIFFWNTSQSRIQDVNVSNNGIGILLSYSGNNTLIGNNASSKNFYESIGISLYDSSNNTLIRNNASNNWNGISLKDSSNNTLIGNNASSSNYYEGIGISLYDSSSNILSGNNASKNQRGISLIDSRNNMLFGNNASKNGFTGISLSSSGKVVLINNIMKGNKYNFGLVGMYDSDFDNRIDTTNMVDGKPLYYIQGVADIVYDSDTNAGAFYCISCVNVTLKNLDLKNNDYGIFFWNTTRSKIQNVDASKNGCGICLSSSSSNTLSKNSASKNYFGIYLSSSSNNSLNRNNASKNEIGIDLYYHSSNNMLRGNNASNNNNLGIYILRSSSNNRLIGNNASNNHGTFASGIIIRDNSNKNTLISNIVVNNSHGYGIEIESSRKNKIYNNIFNNTNNFYFSSSKINTWNTTMQSGTNIIGGSFLGGNYWANPQGTGFSQTCKNGDGICDKRYILDAENIDYLPLAKDKH